MSGNDATARVFEVDDVVSALERVLSEHTRTVRIRGEVVNLRSGRGARMFWFRLEDPRDGMDARVDCFAWATDVGQGYALADGDVVQAVARPEFSRRDGRLIIRLHRIEPAGEGAILRTIEERRRRLAAEGLFDQSLKRALPFVPRGIGLVTARAGAARADVLQRIEARLPVPVIVVQAAMQGSACADEVVRALALLDADPRVDVIIIARGGGSLQDLLPFSDETIVRAIRATRTPVVAGIGHHGRDPGLSRGRCRGGDANSGSGPRGARSRGPRRGPRCAAPSPRGRSSPVYRAASAGTGVAVRPSGSDATARGGRTSPAGARAGTATTSGTRGARCGGCSRPRSACSGSPETSCGVGGAVCGACPPAGAGSTARGA